MPGGMFMSDRDMTIVIANRRYSELFDFPEDLLAAGQPLAGMIKYQANRGDYGDRSQNELIANMTSLFADGKEHHYERHLRNGRTMEVFVGPTPDGGAVAVAADITERKQAEIILKESEEGLSAVLEASPVGVTIFDDDNKRIYANTRIAEMSGRVKAELIGADSTLSYADLAVRDDLQARYAAQGRVDDFEAEFLRADGTGYWVLLTMTPVSYGGKQARLVWIYDITERKRAEEALAEQKALMEVVFENMDEGVVLYDSDMVVTAFNEQARRHMRFPKDVMFTGASFKDIGAYAVSHGDPETGDTEAQTAERREDLKKGIPHSFEYAHTDGTVIETRRRIVPDGGFVVTHSDITERKRAEAAQRESEERFREFAESSSDWFWEMGPDLRFTYFSELYSEATGFGADYRIGTRREDFIPASEIEQNPEKWAGHRGDLEARRPFKGFEYVSTARDGEIHYVSTSGRPFFDADGAFLGYRGTGTDITERKRAEQEVKDSRELLQSLADTIPEFISFKDLDGRFQFVNKCFEDWTQQDRRDVIGKTAHDIYPERQAATFADQDRECLDSQQVISREVLLDYPNGNARTVISTRFPVRSSTGDVLGVGTVNYDLTERKAMEDALHESERQLIELLDVSPIAISIFDHFDRGGRRLYGNSRLVEMLGLERETLIGKGSGPFRAGDLKRLNALYKKDGVVHDFDIEGQRPNGEKFWATVTMAPIEFEGNPAIILWTYDVTDRRHAQAALEASKAAAEQAEREATEKANLLELTLQSMGQGLTMYDGDWNLVTYNQHYKEQFDLPNGVFDGAPTFDDVVGATMGLDYGPERDERLKIVKDPSRMTDVWRREFTRPNGRSLDVLSVPIPTGGFVVTTTDITERRQAEEALRESEARLTAILEASPIGVVIFTVDGKRLYVNARNSEMLGRSKEELLSGKAPSGYVHPVILKNLMKQYEEDGRVYDAEFELLRADGSSYWTLVTMEPTEYRGEAAYLYQ